MTFCAFALIIFKMDICMQIMGALCMKALGLNEIREKFLQFFESKAHLRMNSFSLVPNNDKSLLIINSGMAPLKLYFTGQEVPPSKRVTTCQKCIRTGDIDSVGKDDRHGTFFEMLGDFSFGDYFKEEIIPWAWEFLTEVMEIPADKLYVSIYEEDDEAGEIWQRKVGLAPERITKLGKDDNFWEHGLGPCGPCSEIHYDRGDAHGCGKPDCAVGCDCDRFMEIWNLVFTQFSKEESGEYTLLSSPNIDTGMGLERIAMVMQNVDSIFDIDTIQAVRDEVCHLAGVTYGASEKQKMSIRIITDHIRSITFMTADGILPSNEGRGYVLRRLLRRAARHGKLLGIQNTFLAELCRTVIQTSSGAYPELAEKKDYIQKLISVEENRFYETLDAGMALLKDNIDAMKTAKQSALSGEAAFKLYDTFGFPLELMQEILEEENLAIDLDGFKTLMRDQREKARSAREETTYMGAADNVYNHLPAGEPTVFTGYDCLTEESAVEVIVAADMVVDEAGEGAPVSVVVAKSPFYAEMGGQAGDAGVLETETGRVVVTDVMKVTGGRFAHVGTVADGVIRTGQKATLSVDAARRMDTARNHSATHLLQKALREVLGTHVEQAGSFVTAERLRFDFTHFAAMTREELDRVEAIVNAKVMEGLAVTAQEMGIEDARKRGAMALFGEKYGANVRVVDMGGYSVELCGGTHLTNTAQVGVCKIVSENGVAAGVRRIEALTGANTIRYFNEMEERLTAAAALVKATPDNLLKRLDAMVSQAKEIERQLASLKSKASGGIADELLAAKTVINGVTVISGLAGELDIPSLRTLGDRIKDKLQNVPAVFVIAGLKDGTGTLLSMATDAAVAKGIKCGDIVKAGAAFAGGNGGGRPNMAQAGIKDQALAKGALEAAVAKVKEQLGA